MRNKHSESSPYESFFNDLRTISVDNILPRRTLNSLITTQKTNSDLVIESIRLNGIDPSALPMIVWENPKKPGFYETLDGDLRLKGIKVNGRIREISCIVIAARTFSEALKIANNLNTHIHGIRTTQPPIQTVFLTFFNYLKDHRVSKNLKITTELKKRIAASLGKKISSTLNRMLRVIRLAIYDALQSNKDFFAKDGMEAFFDLLGSEKQTGLKTIYETGKVFKGYTEIVIPKSEKKAENGRKDDCPPAATNEVAPEKDHTREIFCIDFDNHKYITDIQDPQIVDLEIFIKSCQTIPAAQKMMKLFVETFDKVTREGDKTVEKILNPHSTKKRQKRKNPNQSRLFTDAV